MKNVDISKKIDGKLQKEIYLGNGVRVEFDSNRIAQYFISETNRFLTRSLVSLNNTYMQTFLQYRSFWLTSTNHKHGSVCNGLDIEREVKSELSLTSDMLDKFNTTMYGSNDSFFAFIDLMKAAMFCRNAAQKLSDYFKRRNFTNNYYECQMLADRCSSIHHNLKTYGSDKQSKKPPSPPPQSVREPKPKRRARPYTMENKPTVTPSTETPITETQKEASTIVS